MNDEQPTTFKPGDVVELKSGSPPMTVEYTGSMGSVLRAYCTWWRGDGPDSADFATESLRRLPQE